MKKLIVLLAFFVLLFGCTTPIQNSKTAESQEIKLGVILFLTENDLTYLAQAIQQGIDIAVEEANSQGGILGKKIHVIYEDDQLNPNKAVTAAHKLVDLDKVDLGFIGVVNTGKAVAPIFNNAKIPLIMIWDAKTREVGLENLPYLFSVGYSTKGAGENMATYASEKLGIKNVAVIYQPDEWSQHISRAFIEKFKQQQNGNVLLDDQVNLETTDFRTAILKANNADAIYFPFVAHGDLFFKQARELGYKGILMTGDSMTDQIITDSAGAAENVYFTQPYDSDTSKMKILKEAYKKKYGKETDLPVFVALGYDAAHLGLEGIKTAGTLDSEAIKNQLSQTKNLEGALAPITIDDFGSSTKLEQVFFVKDKKMILAQ